MTNPADTFERPAGVIRDKAFLLRWLCRTCETVAVHFEQRYAADCFCGDNEHGCASPNWHHETAVVEFVETAVLEKIERDRRDERKRWEAATTRELAAHIREGCTVASREDRCVLRALLLRCGINSADADALAGLPEVGGQS